MGPTLTVSAPRQPPPRRLPRQSHCAHMRRPRARARRPSHRSRPSSPCVTPPFAHRRPRAAAERRCRGTPSSGAHAATSRPHGTSGCQGSAKLNAANATVELCGDSYSVPMRLGCSAESISRNRWCSCAESSASRCAASWQRASTVPSGSAMTMRSPATSTTLAGTGAWIRRGRRRARASLRSGWSSGRAR